MSERGKILTILELPDSALDEIGRGLLSYTSRLANFSGYSWGVATLTKPDGDAVKGLGDFATPSVKVIESADQFMDRRSLLGKMLGEFVISESASIIILPHNDLGSELAPLIAASVGSALISEVIEARVKENGLLHLTRSALGGRITETRTWNRECPLVMTVPLRRLSQVLLPGVIPTNPHISSWFPATPPVGGTATVTNRIPPDPQTVDLTEAEVIFSAGKGCDPATFEQLKELCRIMNVSFGVTRPVYDMGWTGFERMVGQTGRTVTPRLYLAMGISGSMHHVGGIKDSKRIVSINIDSKAPIFSNSDEGFVGDLKEILPRLLSRAQGGVA